MSNTKLEDESGILTSNVAILEYINNELIIYINLRVPVSIALDEIFFKYTNLKSTFSNLDVQKLGIQEPLFVEKDNYLVKTLVDIGGGTSARAFPNCISYGATMPGDKDMCHQVDEFIEIDKLILSTKIYADAIYELSK